ncbi:non-specific lipid transfer protein GPI-anchored 19-like isoform X2 [Dioscorea cayenensis subsp. rotundata]|uniref:Non-specific lipid transfer protein GPI-anchored 19-like isoform X2 n=1 Tax=Dioscorea cayennensis subsp. rotundata TaxID=55577 RepID=A0AB40CIX8_DIOCR|nr:non-specific lipid transfer protein GPI-anchored 19-like isoform X2 [Dioscorea cayenensis subsp. rotundata]
MNLAMQSKVKLAMVIVCMLCYQSMGQLSCMPFATSLSSCMSYIMGNATAPSPLCCSNLADVIQTQARCLCTVLNSGAAQLGIPVNQTQALTLPGVCSVTVPALSQCNAAAGTTQGAQVPTSSAIPLAPPASVGTASPSTPTNPSVTDIPNGKTSQGVSSAALLSAKSCNSMLSLVIIFASYVSINH